MDLQQFAEMARKRIQEKIREKGVAEHILIEKNNQVVRAGIGIKEGKGPVFTVVNIEAYYEQYRCGGIGIEEAIEDICQVLAFDAGSQEDEEERFLAYQKMKDKIVFRLINREKNQERLKEITHIPFLDMEIEFRLLLGRNGWGQKETLVRQELCEDWKVDAESLFAQAKENMVRLYPSRLQSMEEAMREIIKRHREDTGEQIPPGLLKGIGGGLPLYVLSNQTGIYGAGALFIAIDSTQTEIFCEDFLDREECLKWLRCERCVDARGYVHFDY